MQLATHGDGFGIVPQPVPLADEHHAEVNAEHDDQGEESDRGCAHDAAAKIVELGGKAPLRDILQAEVAGEHIEKKPVDVIDWDTKTLVEEGELESGRPTRRNGKLLVTDKLPDLSCWQC